MTPTRLAATSLALIWGIALPLAAQESTAPAAPDAPTSPDAATPDAAVPDAVAGEAPAEATPDAPAADLPAGETEVGVEPPPLSAPPPLPVTPPPLPEPEPEVATTWIEEAGAQGGPYTLTELQEKIAAGTLTAATLAWSEGMAAWTPAGEVPDLAPLFTAQPAPDPLADPAQPAGMADLATFIVGVWRQQGPMMLDLGTPGFADLTTEFRADGSYAAQGSVSATINGQQVVFQVASQGTYTAQAMEGAQFSITMSGSMQSTSALGSETLPVQNTTTYERVDQGTVRDTTTGDLLTRAGG